MDNVREKLVELLESINAYAEENLGFDKASGGELIDFHGAEYIADHLLANNVTVQEWIPVTERLPNVGEEVLVFDTRENWIGFAWLHPDKTWTALGFDWPFDFGEVTHWMPLPQPPKGE